MKSNIKVASNVTLPAPFNTIAHFYLDVIRGVSYECRFRCPKIYNYLKCSPEAQNYCNVIIRAFTAFLYNGPLYTFCTHCTIIINFEYYNTLYQTVENSVCNKKQSCPFPHGPMSAQTRQEFHLCAYLKCVEQLTFVDFYSNLCI